MTRTFPVLLVSAALYAGAARAQSSGDTLGSLPVDQWLQAPAGVSGSDLRGSVVLVEFWTFLCENCKHVEEWMKETHARYGVQGLRVVGVHSPEFEAERKVENVREYLKKNGIRWPVGIDNQYRVWSLYNETNAWPAFLVYDRRGRLVYREAGEDAVQGADEAIRRTLAEKPTRASVEQGTGDVRITATAARSGPRQVSVTVTLEPEPGHRLVKSPPNDIWLTPEGGTVTRGFLGEPFAGAESREVRYFDGPASLTIPLKLARDPGKDSVRVHGLVAYRACDDVTKVCYSRQARLAVAVGLARD